MNWIRRGVAVFFEYDTPRIAHIKSKKVGIINRLIQLAIIGYIVGYAIIYKKGYQEFGQVQSAITTKLKGIGYTNPNITDNPLLQNRTWDVADYVIPPQENNAFFVMTNVVYTPGQERGICDEDPGMQHVNCSSDRDCPANTVVTNGNGVRTGKCGKTKICQIRAWCPVEIDITPKVGLIQGVEDFTVLVKNSVRFPKFDPIDRKRRNIEATLNKSYLTGCVYDKDKDPFCPIFRIGDIIDDCGSGESIEKISVHGGVIAIEIIWNCNLDFSETYCKPEYSFRRLDDPNALLAKGWNFRKAYHYWGPSQNNATVLVEKRDLLKAYGLRFIVFVSGTASKFNMMPLVINLASGLALLSLATLMCDYVVMYLLKKGNYYKEKKYLTVTGDDAFFVEIDEGRHSPAGSISQSFNATDGDWRKRLITPVAHTGYGATVDDAKINSQED